MSIVIVCLGLYGFIIVGFYLKKYILYNYKGSFKVIGLLSLKGNFRFIVVFWNNKIIVLELGEILFCLLE